MDKKGFTLMEVLIGIAILEILIVTTTTILFQINKINRKTSTSYECIKVAQSYMEEIKNNIMINGEPYLTELTHKNTYENSDNLLLLDSSYTMKLKVKRIHQDHDISSNNLYLVSIYYKDKSNKLCILECYINSKEEPDHEYLELPVSEKNSVY